MCDALDPFQLLSEEQREKLVLYEELVLILNKRLNLISRTTERHIRERHVLHSLAITYRSFPSGSNVVDWGAGGGLPVVPLAIAFPHVSFHAVEAIAKKVQAMKTFARRLNLENLTVWQTRAEAWEGTAHFSVSRATAPLSDLWNWHRQSAAPDAPKSSYPPLGEMWKPGLICLKGGDLEAEISALRATAPTAEIERIPLYPLLQREYFRDKYLLAVH